MLDWCPVCENLIPPERYTIQLPPLNPQPATTDNPADAPDKAPVQPAKATASGGKHGAKRPGLTRQNTKQAAAGKKAKGQAETTTATTATAAAVDPPSPAPAPPRQRTVISQGPTPLYCSEKCRLEDEAASHAFSQIDVWQWANAAPFAYGYGVGARSPLPIAETSTSPPGNRFRPETSTSNSTATTMSSTTTDGEYSPSGYDPRQKRPSFAQGTVLPRSSDSQSHGPAGDVASSAPATTDVSSHPPNALLAAPAPHGVPLDRWRVQPPTQEPDQARLTHANGLSAVDLYTAAYPLAYAGNRPQMYWRPSNGSRGSRNPSRKPTPSLWDDVTPTQSLLIPKREKTRKDDSLEPIFSTSGRSDSGSSERSGSTTSHHRRKHRSRSSHQEAGDNDHDEYPQPPHSRSRSSRSGHSSSSRTRHNPSSLGNSKQHFQARRQSNHPLSSSFSAKDTEDETLHHHRKSPQTSTSSSLTGGISQSVPTDRSNSSWSWVWAPKMMELAEHVPSTASSSTTTTTNAPLPISTSSSSATIAALPASVSTRLASIVDGGSSSSLSTRFANTSSASPPTRNSSLANLAGVAASLFGFGGMGGLTMTSSKSVQPMTGPELVIPAPEDPAKDAAEPIRGRSRASSRAGQGHQLLNNGNSTSSIAASSSTAALSSMSSQSALLPLSMTMEDMPRARRPLAPLPKELEVKRSNGHKTPLSVDVNGKRKEKVDKSPSVGRDESKSPVSAPKSAWDPDLVRGMKESRRLSREQQSSSTFISTHPKSAYQNGGGAILGGVNPFHTSPPTSPSSPQPHLPSNHRRRTTSHSQSQSKSNSHSRSQSYSNALPEDEVSAPLPRVQSNQSMASMTTTSSTRQHRRGHGGSREPPSPSATAYSIAGPPAARALPRGLSMTSLSQQMMQPSAKTSMYGAPVGPSSGGTGINRTTSQPYVSRWFSTSPGAGASAFGSPSGPGPAGYLVNPGGMYATMGVGAGGGFKPQDPKPTGPTYPVLVLPSGTRKKKVWTKVKQADGREEDVLVDGDEDEDVYEKKKRLFYFDR